MSVLCNLSYYFTCVNYVTSRFNYMVYVQQCASNSVLDGSMLPLVDGNPISLRAPILVDGYPNILSILMLIE